MLNNFKFVLTKVGQEALLNAINSNADLNLTHVQFGTSSNNLNQEYESIALDNAVILSNIANGGQITHDRIRIFSEVESNASHSIKEIGVWSGDPSKSGSVLFAYAVSANNDPFAIFSKSMDLVFSLDLVFDVQDLSHVKVIISDDLDPNLAVFVGHALSSDSHPYYMHKERNNTITGINTFNQLIDASVKHSFDADHGKHADSVETAEHATTAKEAETAPIFATARKIHGVDFDGSTDIELAVFSAEKSGVAPKATEDDQFLRSDGTWQKISIDADSAETVERLKTARNININGAVTGTATPFDGSKDIEIPTTRIDASKVIGSVPSAKNANNAETANNAANVTKAHQAIRLSNSRFISIKGGANSGAIVFNGSSNVVLQVASVDGSHVDGAVPTAKKLEIAKKIHGVDFDGSKNIELPLFTDKKSGLAPRLIGDNEGKFLSEMGWAMGYFSSGFHPNATWLDVTNRRELSVSYFNESENDSIGIIFTARRVYFSIQASKDGITWSLISLGGTITSCMSTIIPPLSYYRIVPTKLDEETYFLMWNEFRNWELPS